MIKKSEDLLTSQLDVEDTANTLIADTLLNKANNVNEICKMPELYKCINDDMLSNKVIITEDRIAHILGYNEKR